MNGPKIEILHHLTCLKYVGLCCVHYKYISLIHGIFNQLRYNYRSKRGVDQWAAITAHNQHCGGDFTDMFGIVRSPGYPLYYPNKKVREIIYFKIIQI